MKRFRTSLLTIILFLFVTSVFAQQNSYEIITYKDEMFGKTIERWKIIGLDGKLWMEGTGEVSRLDGDTWTTFILNDILSVRSIVPKAVSPDGVLWFIAPPVMKLYCFDGETWTSLFLWHEGMPVFPNVVAVGHDGVVWAGGMYGVLFYYKDDIWTKTTVDFALGNAIDVDDLTFDHDSVLYAATNSGVYMHKDGKWINTYGPEGMEQDDAKTLAIGPDGKVWVGTYYGEVSYFDGNTWTKIVEYTEIQRKIRDISNILYSIRRDENDYSSSKGEYINFDFGEDCEPIGWNAAYEEEKTGFEYSFQDSIATAREKVDVNGDGDTADGLTYSVSRIRGVLPGSNITWESMYGEGPSGKVISNMEFSSYGELWVGASYFESAVYIYDNGTWEECSTNDVLDDKPTSLHGITPNGVVWLRTEKGVWQLIPTQTIVETDESIPSEFAITGNYPNPFNPTTTIEFTIPETGFVNLTIYNVTGQKIRELVSDTMTAGTHSVMWDGRYENGMMVSSGIYISSLNSGEHVTAGRMLLMK